MISLLDFLTKEHIVPLNKLQKNPVRALGQGVTRITRNGNEFGIFFRKEDWDDFLELIESSNKDFQAKIKKIRKEDIYSAKEVLKKSKL